MLQWVLSLPIPLRMLLDEQSALVSPHTAVQVQAPRCNRLQPLCSPIAWPALADDGLQLQEAGPIESKLRAP